MASPDLNGIAESFTGMVDDLAVVLHGNALRTYPREPRDFDTLPGLAVRFQRFQRRGVDEADVQLGGAYWELEYVVTLAVALDDPDQGQRDITTVLRALIAGVDAAPSLGRGDVDDAVLTSGDVEFTDDEGLPRQLAVATCQLTVLALST